MRIKLEKFPESLPFTPDGTRFVKNISRVESIVEEPVPTNKNVPLFRLNSVLSDKGSQLEGEEPQRQQWDNPIEFLMSCISMSVGLGNEKIQYFKVSSIDFKCYFTTTRKSFIAGIMVLSVVVVGIFNLLCGNHFSF